MSDHDTCTIPLPSPPYVGMILTCPTCGRVAPITVEFMQGYNPNRIFPPTEAAEVY